MKKALRKSVYVIAPLLLVLACTKEIGLVTEVEFELTEQHAVEGYVNQTHPTRAVLQKKIDIQPH